MAVKDNSRFEDRFHDLFERLFQEIDQEAIEQEVRNLEANNPAQSREWLARLLIRKGSMSAALIGAGAGLPGGALGILAMAPDIFNLVRQQSRLVLSIAFLYGQPPGTKERFREVLATIAVSTGASAGRQGVRYLVQKGLEGKAARSILARIAARFTTRKLPSLAPILGGAAGAGINYLTVQATGKIAIDYYSKRASEPSEQLDTAKSATASTPETLTSDAKRAAKNPKQKTSTKRVAASSKESLVRTATATTGVRKKRGAKQTPSKSTASRKSTVTKRVKTSPEESH